VKLLDEEGVDFERVDYFVDALTKPRLAELLGKAGLKPRDVLRKRDAAYKTLSLDDPGKAEGEILDAIVAHPGLLQRPIVERGSRAVLGRPIERVRELL
jgi:arsenate reductase